MRKNRFRLPALLLVLVLLLAACGEKTDTPPSPDGGTGSTAPAADGGDPVTPPSLLELVRDGKSLATAVFPDNAGETLRNAVKALQAAVKEKTGATLLASVAGDTTAKPEKTELLIGDTGREESVAQGAGLAGYMDYSVRVIGNKLVLSGKNEDAVVRAVYWFINQCVKKVPEDQTSLTFSSEQNYLYHGNYPMENLKLFEKAIAGYRIVVPANADITVTRFASYLCAYLCNMTGVKLPVVTDSEPATECEIRIGRTARTETTVKKYEYAVTVKGNAVDMVADSLYGYEAAYAYAINGFLTSARTMKPQTAEMVRKDISSELTGGTENILSHTGDVRVMFHNIWGWNESETNPTEQRNQMLAATYLEYLPDILCLQECTMMMRNASRHPIAAALLSAGYEELTQDAIDGKLTATPILYRTEKLELLEKGQYKFPVGGGDDKFVTWGVFRDRESGRTFGVLSVHLAYQLTEQGDTWRYDQVGEVAGIVAALRDKYDCPIITGGDMNSTTQSRAYRRYLDSGFTDVQGIAAKSEDSNTNFGYPTFSADAGMFERPTITKKGSYKTDAIDHVFVSGSGLRCDTFDIVTDTYVLCASDHTPVLVEFSFDDSAADTDREAPGDYTWRY